MWRIMAAEEDRMVKKSKHNDYNEFTDAVTLARNYDALPWAKPGRIECPDLSLHVWDDTWEPNR